MSFLTRQGHCVNFLITKLTIEQKAFVAMSWACVMVKLMWVNRILNAVTNKVVLFNTLLFLRPPNIRL